MPDQYTSFNFFPNQRRRIELLSWSELMNAQSEKRIRFDLQMPLTGQNLVGMPEFIGRGFEIMGVEGSHDKKIDIDAELEGVHFEAFSTDTCKRAIPIESLGLNLDDEKKQLERSYVKFSSATIRNFKLVKIENNAVVVLQFNVTVKSDAGLVLWAHHYHGATFWATFSEAQLVVPKKDDPDQMKLGDEDGTVKDAVKKLVDSVPEGTKMSIEVDGKSHVIADKTKRGKGACPAIDSEGGHCVLDWNHDEDHMFSNGKPVDLAKKGKKAAEA